MNVQYASLLSVLSEVLIGRLNHNIFKSRLKALKKIVVILFAKSNADAVPKIGVNLIKEWS